MKIYFIEYIYRNTYRNTSQNTSFTDTWKQESRDISVSGTHCECAWLWRKQWETSIINSLKPRGEKSYDYGRRCLEKRSTLMCRTLTTRRKTEHRYVYIFYIFFKIFKRFPEWIYLKTHATFLSFIWFSLI